MNFLDEGEFLRTNDIIANKRVQKILICCTLVGPLLILGKFLGVFETDYLYSGFITLIAVIEVILQYNLCEKEQYYKVAKYSGLIAVQIVIGLMAVQTSIGVYITYIFIPVLSCMYFDFKLTRNISILGYLIMLIALYFRSFGAVVRDYPNFTQMQWFVSQTVGFTIEYGLTGIVICALAKYLKGMLNSSYEKGKEKFYTEEANKVKNVFLTNISDELRLPINEIARTCEKLVEEEVLSVSACKKIRAMTMSSQLLHSMIDDILDFSHMQLEKAECIEEVYQISELIEDVKNAIYSRIGDKNIDLDLVINPFLPNELYGDKIRIRQILITLLNHTIKSMTEGFVLLKIDWKRQEELAILYVDVMDTGIGIREEDFNRMYESFWQSREPSEEMIEGMSIGLPICKRLCEGMNGTISVTDKYGKGNVFNVILPQKIASDNMIYSDVMCRNKMKRG